MMAQTKKELIEKLEGLATFFTLAASNAERETNAARKAGSVKRTSFCAGRQTAYNVAFAKTTHIIKEAK